MEYLKISIFNITKNIIMFAEKKEKEVMSRNKFKVTSKN
jgi:hypothetical protein